MYTIEEESMQHKLLTQKSTGSSSLLSLRSRLARCRFFARLAYELKADPLTVLFLRFSIAAAGMFVMLFVSKTPFPRGITLFELILLGAIGYVGESLAYFTALTMASAGLVALLLYIYPALVTTISAIFLKEHLTTIKIVRYFWLFQVPR